MTSAPQTGSISKLFNQSRRFGVLAQGVFVLLFLLPALAQTQTNSNPQNLRPYNPTNAASLPPGTAQPSTTIKASEYGAVCDGVHDDTVALQSAVDALAIVSGGAPTPRTTASGVVELPQGRCEISSTIVLKDHASIQGSRNGSWLLPLEPWLGGSNGDLIDLTVNYSTKGVPASEINRFVKDINFMYNYNATNHTAIRVYNPAGQQATPYPAEVEFAHYQIPGVIISGNSFFALDTAVVFQDCGECSFVHNQINFVRVGVEDSGNNYGLVIAQNGILQGTWNDSTRVSHSTTYGIYVALENRYICSNKVPHCAGGTVSQTEIVSPQGLNIESNDISTFDTDLYVYNMQGLVIHGGGFDYGGGGPAAAANPTGNYPAIFFGPTILATQISDTYVASSRPGGIGLEIGAPTSVPGGGETYNDMDIHDVYFFSYNAESGIGIRLDQGNYPARGYKLNNNSFGSEGYGIQINHPLQYSVIEGNYGFGLSGNGALIDLNASGSGSFTGTAIADNTSSTGVLAVYDQAGSGYYLGRNESPAQLLGTQVGAAAGCTITAGAIGNVCASPVTVSWPQKFADSSYLVNCGLQGGKGNNSVTAVNILNGASVQVNEVALSTTATGGGTIVCTATHN